MIIAFIIIGIATLVGRQVYIRTKPAAIETNKVTREDLTQFIEVSGEIDAEEKVDLHFQTIGRLAWVGVKEGDRVKKWQAVAAQDRRTLEKQLKKDLIVFEKEFRDFDQALDDNPLVNLEFKRILEKAQFDLDSSVIDVEIRNLAVELATLVSPIEGIVTNIDTPVAGVNVTAVDSITIINPETLYFSAEVDETDIAAARIGQKTTILLDAYPETEIESTISWIGFQATTSEGGGTVFLIKLVLPKLEGIDYRLGLNGDASLITDERQNVLILPLDAVEEDDQGKFVLVSKNGEFIKNPVETGLETDDDIEITSGLSEGDSVILPDSLGEKLNISELRREAHLLRSK